MKKVHGGGRHFSSGRNSPGDAEANFDTLSTYPFLLLGNPTGDFLTETEPLGGRLGGPLVSFQQVSTRALRAHPRAALRAAAQIEG